jgi:adenylylsulfate kinase
MKRGKSLLPGVIWITGLVASGKTTLSSCLYKKLKSGSFSNVELMDGESFREQFSNKYGSNHKLLAFNPSARKALTVFYVNEVINCVNSGSLVIAATLDAKVKSRQNTRKQIQRFMEVYLDCPVEVLAKRDYKDHYRRAFNKEEGYEDFPGVSAPYELSGNSELVLDTNKFTIDECSIKLYQEVLRMFQTHKRRKQ